MGVGIFPAQSVREKPLVSSQPESEAVIKYQEHIDQTNEEVQKLLQAEMGTVEECIRAIELYGTATKAAPHMEQEEALHLESSVLFSSSEENSAPHQNAFTRLVTLMVSLRCN